MDTISAIKYYFLIFIASVKYLFSLIVEKFNDYPYEVKIAIIFISFSVVMILFIQFSISAFSLNRKGKGRLRRTIENKYGHGMDYVLSSVASGLMTPGDIATVFGLSMKNFGKPLLSTRQEKEVFADIFYHKFISNRSEQSKMENIHSMLYMFGIPEYLEREVSHGNMKRKVRALNKMRPMKLPINVWIINTLINSKSLHIQRLAMYSTIMSSSDSALDYFETDFFDKHCCIKDEIELAYSLQRRRKAGLKLPNLARWAHIQKDEKAQCMFVRLMRRFDEIEYCGQLTDLFSLSKKKKLIEEISRTWGYLHYVESEDLLIDALLTQPDDTKVAIMHALTRLATGRSLHALMEGFTNTTNPHVRYEALRCIYNYGEEGRKKFYELEQSAKDPDKKYFTFFNNPITLEKVRLDREQAYHPSVETVFNG